MGAAIYSSFFSVYEDSEMMTPGGGRLLSAAGPNLTGFLKAVGWKAASWIDDVRLLRFSREDYISMLR